MGRLRRKVWILLGCGIAVALILTLWREREPRYEGKSLSQWIAVFETSGDVDLRPEATQAVRHIGTNAVPFLLDWIQYEERPWRSHLGALCNKLPNKPAEILSRLVVGRGFERQQEAFIALYALGPDAKTAIPTITRLINTRPIYVEDYMGILAHIGNDGLAPILSAITNRANPYRDVALSSLSGTGTKFIFNQTIASVVTDCLGETNRELAFCAAQILCFHHANQDLALRTLIDGTAVQDKKLQRQAIMRLRISLKYGYSVPALLEFLQDPNSPLSPYAAGVLGELARDGTQLPEAVFPALTNALHDPRPRVRAYACSAVGDFRAAAEPVAPVLLNLWNDPDASVRQSATNAFFELPAYAVLRNVREWPAGMSDEQMEMYERRYGIRLHRHGVTNLLNDPDIRVREIATNAFRHLREANNSKTAVPEDSIR